MMTTKQNNQTEVVAPQSEVETLQVEVVAPQNEVVVPQKVFPKFGAGELKYLKTHIPRSKPKNINYFRDCMETEDLKYMQWKPQSFADVFTNFAINHMAGIDQDYVVKLLEDLFLLVGGIWGNVNPRTISMSIVTFIKLRTNKPILSERNITLLTDYYNEVIGSWKVESYFEDKLGDARNLLDKYDLIKDSAIVAKLYKFCMFALSLSLFDSFGINFNRFNYTKLEKEAIRRQYSNRVSFVHCLLDTILFLCESGYQCMQTGINSSIFHSGPTYVDWFDKCVDLQIKSNFLSNPEAHNFTKFEFFANLDSMIEKGNAIYSNMSKASGSEKAMVGKHLTSLKMIKGLHITKEAALQTRKAPFGCLLFGGSSVGKSTLVKTLFYHFGKVANLPQGDKYLYTRNSADKHWNNFSSPMWCIVLDDIGFMNPTAAPAGDPSLIEAIQIYNNIPISPPQAALEDKGRTPILSELVIGTTNTQDLNVQAYFSCPLAIQRRFGFVIEAKPRPEFAKMECMLDSSKVIPISDGEYPDYWLFTVKFVKPGPLQRGKQVGVYEVVTHNNIVMKDVGMRELLPWYTSAIREHRDIQNKVMNCDKIMSDVKICLTCALPLKWCTCKPQSMVTQSGWILYCCVYWLLALMSLGLFGFILMYVIKVLKMINTYITFGRSCVAYVTHYKLKLFGLGLSAKQHYYRMKTFSLGFVTSRNIGYCKRAAQVAGAVTVLYATYKSVSCLLSVFAKNKLSEPQVKVIRPEPVGEEKTNVWKNTGFRVTELEVSAKSLASQGPNKDVAINAIAKNCVCIRYTFNGKTTMTRGFCVIGNIYIFNNHAIAALYDDESFDMDLIQDVVGPGVTRNVKVRVSNIMLTRDYSRDICVMIIKSIPSKRSIIEYFPKVELGQTLECLYLTRSEDGSIIKKNVHAAKFHNNGEFGHGGEEFPETMDAWVGHVEEPTKFGDCGSLLVATSAPYGVVILGFHFIGNGADGCGSISVTSPLLESMVYSNPEFAYEPNKPVLNTSTKTHELVDLHYKSPVRWLNQGRADVHGSFIGFRGSMKSRVQRTLICESAIRRGYKPQGGAPIMAGWEPWYNALHSMVEPAWQFNENVLSKCCESLTKDILKGLGKFSLDLIGVYDDFTAINGAAGVAYVDSINRNTSMGFPWCKSKKYFLTPDVPQGQNLDPVKFDAEFMARVDDVIAKYTKGELYRPVFSMSLKDEVIKQKKIDDCATRGINAAPADWCIAVRKYLLSFVRLVQNNKLTFESGVGTVAQSLEWQEILHYLTKFGPDTMIAGDYKAFDKKMSSLVMFYAIKVIVNIYRAAGQPEEVERFLWGYLWDVCFPLTNVNGDLVTLYGTHPSGEPLTVIVNDLMNSISCRYAYYYLNPDKEVDTFQENVRLITYGDDNVMGVKPTCSWFDHTGVQRVLGEAGLVYTMADKDRESVPYIHISEVSFLKRKFVWDEDIGAVVAPLDHGSLNKMLTMWVASKTISAQEQSIEVMSSCLREYFYYGRNIYNEKRSMMMDIVVENGLLSYETTSSFPTWESLKKQFWELSKHVDVDEISDVVKVDVKPLLFECGLISPSSYN